ncbi:acyltransferase [Ralstonia sp. SET104]|uniref:acyltransferase family protein n=1 Tax=Ralstonia sp. SET104 TaxID=2448774 RepID=UPI000F57EB9A|nr:acyltransferase [Ralstonia sp. SET104]
MSPFSIWPAFFIIAACLALVTPARPWVFLDAPPSQSSARYTSLDGLRGFLALAVVMHHTSITYGYVQTGIWQLPPSSFYAMLGQVGVAVFFMITAFLFWGRLLDEGSRINWAALYCNRFFRIVPLYLAAVAFMFAVVAHRTGFQLHVPVTQLVGELFQWILPSIIKVPPGINGYAGPGLILAGVTWTIYYEWLFYLSLPLLAVGAKSRSPAAFLPIIAFLLIYSQNIFDSIDRYFIALFFCGMFAASMARRSPNILGDNKMKSVACVVLLFAVFLRYDTAYAWGPVLLLGAFFLLISSGATLFGLLKSRGAQRLGNISYSIYLLQGPVLVVLFSQKILGKYALQSPEHYWLVALLVSLILVCISTVTYRFIEKPGISLGRQLIRQHAQTAAQRAPLDAAALPLSTNK